MDGPTRTRRAFDLDTNAPALHPARTHRLGDELALCADDRPAFVEALSGARESRMVPVTAGDRYREAGPVYLLDDSDATAAVYESESADRVADVRDRLPEPKKRGAITDGAPAPAPLIRGRREERRDVRVGPGAALVVGMADQNRGESVTAIERREQGKNARPGACRAHVRELLAGSETRKRIVFPEETLRAPNGKVDRERAKAVAAPASTAQALVTNPAPRERRMP